MLLPPEERSGAVAITFGLKHPEWKANRCLLPFGLAY